MKKLLAIILLCTLLVGCGADAPTDAGYESRFDAETRIELSDDGLKVSGVNAMAVFASNDIIYYEDRDTYDSGKPYGEGEAHERHSKAEADAHTVVNITAAGAYRISGKLSAGQLRVDLGDDAYEDENAVVELILENADITCTVAPAILFLNVYECDGDRDVDTATPAVDTAAAGANLILAGENTVNGSHVARIFKDKKGEKKLWKQDGAIYSYMSMNVAGTGALTLNADNEGLDTELHLTINGGDISIFSGNDGINTNEDGVSVTTINGGRLYIVAGLGAEGDGIDSNGYLVINGGDIFAAAHPASDAGLDSDLGSFIHGGTLVALGAAMDWAESDSAQVTMNLQFAQYQTGGISVTREDGTAVFSHEPDENARRYQGAILSCAEFRQGESYHVFADGVQMAYTGTDVMQRPHGGMRPDGNRSEPPMPEGQEPPEMPSMPAGEVPPNGFGGGQQPPDGFDGQVPNGETPPDKPEGGRPNGFPQMGAQTGEASTVFFMQDKVNFFSGLTAADF